MKFELVDAEKANFQVGVLCEAIEVSRSGYYVTYIATGEGWSYLAVLLDLFSRRVVGWAMSTTNDTALALAALNCAVSTRHYVPAGLVHHTDRGSPYASDDYRNALAEHGMTQSMSRTGDCWDAVAESFFATLRAELVDHETYATGCGGAVHRRLHRQLLQRRTAALASRLRQSDRVRIEVTRDCNCGIVNLSTETGELHPPGERSRGPMAATSSRCLASAGSTTAICGLCLDKEENGESSKRKAGVLQ